MRKLFPELNSQWIYFDDNEDQIESCKLVPNVTAILATTDRADKSCYTEVQTELRKWHHNILKKQAVHFPHQEHFLSELYVPEGDPGIAVKILKGHTTEKQLGALLVKGIIQFDLQALLNSILQVNTSSLLAI